MLDKSMDATGELRTHHVFEALRFDLLEGNILPGARLKFVELAKRFGISQTVVREALTRLCEQGLVENSPKRGFAVTPLSTSDLVDLTRIRLRLEVLAMRDSIEKGDMAWETGLVAAHHALDRTPFVTVAPQSAATWRQLHRGFHQALCAGSGSPRLEKVVSKLRDSAELYRIWSRSLGKQWTRDTGHEHRGLLDAALARDADLAEEILVEHINSTTNNLLQSARAQGVQ